MRRMHLTGPDQPLLVILGATATGKTHLATAIARQIDAEIISADSRQIYRYMDIGTAKPTTEEQSLARHHLIDVVEPDQNLTLAEYLDQARAIITALHRRGSLPMLVGGTGQYISALVEGWTIPRVEPNPMLRTELEAFANESGNEALHARLQAVDPEAATNIHPNNVRRVIRALEVYAATGQPISLLQRKQPPPYRLRTIGLTLPREQLYERADRRVDSMMEQGFLDEVRGLLDRGYDRSLPSMSGLGYLELAAHLLDDLPLDEAVQRTKNSTHDFIRRQDVWFRGHDHGIVWHNGKLLDQNDLIADIGRWNQERN